MIPSRFPRSKKVRTVKCQETNCNRTSTSTNTLVHHQTREVISTIRLCKRCLKKQERKHKLQAQSDKTIQYKCIMNQSPEEFYNSSEPNEYESYSFSKTHYLTELQIDTDSVISSDNLKQTEKNL